MGYNKVIIYGRNVDVYKYEKSLPDFIRGNRTGSKRDVYSSVVDDREDALRDRQKQQVEKRKDNAKRACMAFRRLVLSNLNGFEKPLLFTVTYAKNITDLKQGYRDFNLSVKALRYKFGSNWKYITVPEFQKRGAIHFHTLLWGLRFEDVGQLVTPSSIPNLVETSYWKHGFAFLKQTDGNERLSSYLVKYMAKAFSAPELKNHKAYVCSRNCTRPVVLGGIDSPSVVVDDYVGSNAVPYNEVRYETAYLGECKKSMYFNNPDLVFSQVELSTYTDIDPLEVFKDW